MNFKLVILSIGLPLSVLFSCKETEVPTSASITGLNCSLATFSSTASANTVFTGTATVPYTGGNGAAYSNGSAIASTGVTGLTATLTAATLASGAGNATFAITGTPSSAGTASFAITVGGQSCTLSMTVSAAGSGTGSGTTGSVWAMDTDIAAIIKAADAFKATLSSTQVAALQYNYTVTQAKLWSNLPQSLYRNRLGLATSTFSAVQWTGFYNLLKTTTGTVANDGLEEYSAIVDADDYLLANGGGSGYGKGNYYIAFLGTPSATEQWCLQIGGHHGTNITTYKAGKMIGGTPNFRSTEPYPTWISTNTKATLGPLVNETTAFANFLKSLSSAELNTAKRAAAQNDIIVGPQKDGTFPSTKTGVKAGNLTTFQRNLLLAAIKTYVDDLDDRAAAAVMAKYTAEIGDTYVSYVGTTDMTAKGDYILIDGPSVWIEWSMQGGIVIRTGNHPHSVWRDRKSDYGGN
jgi:hypothetical protein